MMVKTKMATYLPRFRVGANSDVTASAVSSLMPAPTPARAIPPVVLSAHLTYGEVCQRLLCLQMKMFMVCAVLETIIPRIKNTAPVNATYRRPIRSDNDPTNGQTAAKASRLASTLYRSARSPGLGLRMRTHKPNPSIRTSDITVDVGWNAACEASTGYPGTHRKYQPKRYNGICEPVHRKAIATRDMILLKDI